MEYFGCLWILCNNGLLKKRTDIESGSGFLRVAAPQGETENLSISLNFSLSLPFSVSPFLFLIRSPQGLVALHQRKWKSLLFSFFSSFSFSLVFLLFLSYSLSHRGWIWVPEGLELGPERACFPLSLYFWRPAFATLFIPCTLIRGNSPADCDAEKNWFCFLSKSLDFRKHTSIHVLVFGASTSYYIYKVESSITFSSEGLLLQWTSQRNNRYF